jgi:MscS family membrane protein
MGTVLLKAGGEQVIWRSIVVRYGDDLRDLKSITAAHDSVEDGPKTCFSGFGDFSMNVLLIYYIKSGEDILGTQTDVNMAILRQFNENGLDMAFPTQTIHNIKN